MFGNYRIQYNVVISNNNTGSQTHVYSEKEDDSPCTHLISHISNN